LAVSEICNHSDPCAVPSMCNTVDLLILLKLCLVFTFLQQLMTRRFWVIYTYTCSPIVSINVVASAPDDPSLQNVFHIQKCVMQLYLLILGSHYCVMHFVHALHMRCQNLVLISCLYLEPFELVIKSSFTTTPALWEFQTKLLHYFFMSNNKSNLRSCLPATKLICSKVLSGAAALSAWMMFCVAR